MNMPKASTFTAAVIMKTKSKLRHFILLAGSLLLAVSSASAGQTWDGGSLTNSNWDTADNWDSNTLPNFANQITFAGATRLTNVNNLDADTTIGGFNFINQTTGQYFSISGNRITLGGDFIAAQFSGGGYFTAANTDAIGIAMILNGNRIFSNGQRRLSNFTGIISESGGARNLTVQGAGAIQLSAANTYSGTTTVSTGPALLINHSLALQNSALNTTASGTIVPKVTTFTLGGLIGNGNLAASGGIFGSVTGHASVYTSVTALTLNPGTGASYSYSGVIANGATNMTLTKTGAGTQTLSGANTYTGATTINAGTLKLGANNVIPNASNVSIGTATLDADTRTDTAGTLDVTGAAVINLGSGAALAFADSKLVDWTGGTLNITGTLGATSLRFGNSAAALTKGPGSQLAKISVNGSELGAFILDADGYLVRPSGTLLFFL
jgi:autotransporter-associated beta strand protein